MWHALIAVLADLWPLSTPDRPPLRRALGFLEWSVRPGDLQAASFAGAFLLGCAALRSRLG